MATHRAEQLRRRIEPLRRALTGHPVYGRIRSPAAVRAFMESHVVAVWDFMSLLKALQRRLSCVEVPWTPPADPAACRLVNEIVLEEESDVDADGRPSSHFDLYRAAMRRCGADCGPIDRLVDALRAGRALGPAIEAAGLPDAARAFVGHTFRVIEGGDLPAVASTFTFGREALLPDVFRRVVGELGSGPGADLDGLRDYLDRHIELDGDAHGPMAERLVSDLCGDDPDRWRSAEDAAVAALEARLALWDAIDARLAPGGDHAADGPG